MKTNLQDEDVRRHTGLEFRKIIYVRRWQLYDYDREERGQSSLLGLHDPQFLLLLAQTLQTN